VSLSTLRGAAVYWSGREDSIPPRGRNSRIPCSLAGIRCVSISPLPDRWLWANGLSFWRGQAVLHPSCPRRTLTGPRSDSHPQPYMEPQEGLSPSPFRLQGGCSRVELPRQKESPLRNPERLTSSIGSLARGLLKSAGQRELPFRAVARSLQARIKMPTADFSALGFMGALFHLEVWSHFIFRSPHRAARFVINWPLGLLASFEGGAFVLGQIVLTWDSLGEVGINVNRLGKYFLGVFFRR
jgi:hypothetical protein